MAGDKSPKLHAEARIGQVFKGRWRIERVIGSGGMAVVYEASHRNQSRVAIKVLRSDAGVTGEQTRRFFREGYAANQVRHAGVVRVHDDDVTEDGCAFLVMELLSGMTVAAKAQENGGSMSAHEVVEVADQLLDILGAAHLAGVLHRDIKPENLFLCEDGHLKLLDFGIARLSERKIDGERTAAGTLLGTPAFLAPEQARASFDEVDERTDLWGVGATMFTLLSGRHVHPAPGGNEQLALAMTRPAPALSSVAPDVPAELCAIVDRALAFERRERWTSAAEMRAALGGLRAGLPTAALVPNRPATTRSANDAVATLSSTVSEIPATRWSSTRLFFVLAGALGTIGMLAWQGSVERPSSASPMGVDTTASLRSDLTGYGNGTEGSAPSPPVSGEPPPGIVSTLAAMPSSSTTPPPDPASAHARSTPSYARKAPRPGGTATSTAPPTAAAAPSIAFPETSSRPPRDPYANRH